MSNLLHALITQDTSLTLNHVAQPYNEGQQLHQSQVPLGNEPALNVVKN